MLKRIEKDFSGDTDILYLLTSEDKLCSYVDLVTTLDTEDFYDLLEMAHVNAALRDDARKKAHQEQK